MPLPTGAFALPLEPLREALSAFFAGSDKHFSGTEDWSLLVTLGDLHITPTFEDQLLALVAQYHHRFWRNTCFSRLN